MSETSRRKPPLFNEAAVSAFLGVLSGTIEPSIRSQSLPSRQVVIRAVEEGVHKLRTPTGLRAANPLTEEDHVQIEGMLGIFRELHRTIPFLAAPREDEKSQ